MPSTERMPDSLLSLSLSQIPLVFVDVETTGLSPDGGDRVCEIAMIRRDTDGVRTEWSSLVDPRRGISPGAFAVNGITAEMLSGAPLFCDLLPRIQELAEDAVWVAHNAAFDLGFLRSEYAIAGAPFPESAVIDTVHIARRHFRFASNRLGALAREFQIANPAAHRALGDCLTTETLFQRMIEKVYSERIPTLGEVAMGKASASRDQAQLPDSLAELIRRNRRIAIVYLSANGHKTERTITVRDVTGGGASACLVADCDLRGDVRHFRLDRIVDWRPAPSSERFGR
ncbi:MAG TPA: exonuclease domain-containing protein [candidate division Zixibacteria bacterium]|nr:exonuclease domain-containing protein [candidate division Zixibacteria bacterium]